MTHLRRRFPFTVPQESQAHLTSVWRSVVRDVGVVDFGCEGDCWWFEGIGWWHVQVDGVGASLENISNSNECCVES